MKTAIVVGSTGLIGQALVKQLASLDTFDSVIAITRKPVKYSLSKIQNEVVNFDQLDEYQQVFNGDVLFSALGTTIKQAGSIEQQRKVDVDYQYHAAQLAAKNGIKHYLLVSSSGANSKSSNAYCKLKGELEDKVAKLNFPRISIMQPSLLLGIREKTRMLESIGAAVIPVLCKLPGLKRFRPIAGEEVAKKMILLSQTTDSGFERFTLDEVFVESRH